MTYDDIFSITDRQLNFKNAHCRIVVDYVAKIN